MRLMIVESNEVEWTIGEFIQDVKDIYEEHFPDSLCSARLLSLAGKYIIIDFYLAGDKGEFPYGIPENDLMSCKFMIHLGDKNATLESEMPVATLESINSVIKTKPTVRFNYCSYTKVPFRKTTGDAEKLLITIDKYVQKLAKTVITEYDNDNIMNDDKELLDKKIDRIR